MFRETLLETSNQERKNRSWSLVIAFTLEATAAAVLIIIPLVSTGIIPVTTQAPIFAPLAQIHEQAQSPERGSGRGIPTSSSTPVVTLASSRDSVCYFCKPATSPSPDENRGPNLNIAGGEGIKPTSMQSATSTCRVRNQKRDGSSFQ